MDNRNSEYVLMHYGVVGMKWGIRRGNASGAYYKSGKKLAKLQYKSQKATKKFDKKLNKRSASNDDVIDAMRKARKKQAKAEKFERARNRAFADINKKDVESGKKMLDEYLNGKRKYKGMKI